MRTMTPRANGCFRFVFGNRRPETNPSVAEYSAVGIGRKTKNSSPVVKSQFRTLRAFRLMMSSPGISCAIDMQVAWKIEEERGDCGWLTRSPRKKLVIAAIRVTAKQYSYPKRLKSGTKHKISASNVCAAVLAMRGVMRFIIGSNSSLGFPWFAVILRHFNRLRYFKK